MARPRSEKEGDHLEGWTHTNSESSLEQDRQHSKEEPPSQRYRSRNSMTDVLAQVVPHDKVYGWVVTEILNIPQRDSLQKAYNKGYRFVPASRHPDIVIPNIDGRHSEDRIYDGGRVLMEIDKTVWDEDQAYYIEQDMDVKRQSRHLTDYLGNDSSRFLVKGENEMGFSPLRQRAR